MMLPEYIPPPGLVYWFTEEEKQEAEERAKKIPIKKDSIVAGAGRIFGALGEIAVRETCFVRFGIEVDDHPNFDWDLKIADQRVDVKSKVTNYEPDESWEASVCNYNTHQDCDYYCFVRVFGDKSRAYILGVMRKDLFYDSAYFVRLGEKHENGWECKADCWNVKISILSPLETLWEKRSGS